MMKTSTPVKRVVVEFYRGQRYLKSLASMPNLRVPLLAPHILQIWCDDQNSSPPTFYHS
jgi:hypothetical protein